jgi:hypothetical protein
MAASPTPTSRSATTSALLSETPPLPWLYSYVEDGRSARLGQPILRPFVPVSLVYRDQGTSPLNGLIDTGADAILASDLLTVELEIDLTENEGDGLVLLGSLGFLDQFTVTASRFAQAVAVEGRDTLDKRFGTVLSG